MFGLFTESLFFIIEWRVASYPIMHLALFRSLPNNVALLATFFHGIVFIAAAFNLPLYFQSVLDHTFAIRRVVHAFRHFGRVVLCHHWYLHQEDGEIRRMCCLWILLLLLDSRLWVIYWPSNRPKMGKDPRLSNRCRDRAQFPQPFGGSSDQRTAKMLLKLLRSISSEILPHPSLSSSAAFCSQMSFGISDPNWQVLVSSFRSS
jgi:hypothetical protein